MVEDGFAGGRVHVGEIQGGTKSSRDKEAGDHGCPSPRLPSIVPPCSRFAGDHLKTDFRLDTACPFREASMVFIRSSHTSFEAFLQPTRPPLHPAAGHPASSNIAPSHAVRRPSPPLPLLAPYSRPREVQSHAHPPLIRYIVSTS